MARGKKKHVETTSDDLTHNPFAALKGEVDRAELPAAGEPPTDDPAPTEEPREAADGPRFDLEVVVRRETKGRGGKTVTRIQGLPPDQRDALAKRMKKALGCAASAEGDDVLLHGAVVDRAVEWLRAEGATRVVAGN